jgi:hypothetical protein
MQLLLNIDTWFENSEKWLKNKNASTLIQIYDTVSVCVCECVCVNRVNICHWKQVFLNKK